MVEVSDSPPLSTPLDLRPPHLGPHFHLHVVALVIHVVRVRLAQAQALFDYQIELRAIDQIQQRPRVADQVDFRVAPPQHPLR